MGKYKTTKRKIWERQYVCGCKGYVITYPSKMKKIFWEYDYMCKIHKGGKL